MLYCIDIDGVVCRTNNGNYQQAVPIKKRIKKINQLYDAGHTIVFNTSRGARTGKDWELLTKRQFKKWNLKHHLILFTKPYADYYLDDHNLSLKEFDSLDI